jgi:hypothetical protein
MPVMPVDRATYTALQLAQAAMAFARRALPYGSSNQLADLRSGRFGQTMDGSVLPRRQAALKSVKALMAQTHQPLGPLGLDDRTYGIAVSTGVAMYYGAGNCGEHANLTFCFLATFGFPGITVHRCTSTVMDHGYTMITWPNCQNAVVSDGWPTNGQACLWSQFFANPHRTQPDPGFREIARFTITDQNMGFDIVGQAYRTVDPRAVTRLPLGSQIVGYSQQAINSYIQQFLGNGVYGQMTTLAQNVQVPLDFSYTSERGTEQLSQALLPGELWSGRVLPTIVEVTGQYPQMMDPAMRYSSSV